MRPHNDGVPPCTAALPHRVPALLYGGVPPGHVHRCLLRHPLPCLHLTVCVHRHLTSLGCFSTPASLVTSGISSRPQTTQYRDTRTMRYPQSPSPNSPPSLFLPIAREGKRVGHAHEV